MRHLLGLVVVAGMVGWGCGDNRNRNALGDDANAVPSDAGADTTPDGSGIGSDGGDGGMTPPGDPNPFPSDPAAGEFAWVVSAPGAGDPVSLAVDRVGGIIVVATQTGDVTLGDVHLPAPTTGQALVALKLTGDGKPIWGRSFAGPSFITARAITTTPTGDIVIGGEFHGGSLQIGAQVLTSAGGRDGFVIVLDGHDGLPQWTAQLASGGDDHVAGIAAGPDATGVDAIYVYGELGFGVTLDGQAFPSGAYLIRYNTGGMRRWADSFAGVDPGYDNSLALDPQRGPVIAGVLHQTLTLGNQLVTSRSMVAGFDPDGQVRFVRPIFTQFTPFSRNLAITPSGDIYVAGDTVGGPTLVDDHVISNPSFHADLLMLRLTPQGNYAFASLVTGERDSVSFGAAVDSAGRSYVLGTCDGTLAVQPEIACSTGEGGVIVSYGADNAYRWSTYIEPVFAESIAAAPGERLIVAGQALNTDVSFGGVRVPTQQLFVAALGTGAVRLPSPLPAPPVISHVALDQAGDGQIREGGTGTLVVDGTALDHVTSAHLGDIDIHVPPSAGTATQLRLRVQIPHAHAGGPLSLTLANAGGSASLADVVTVTPIVVGPGASPGGRGTFSSPMPLCSATAVDQVRYGDVLLVLDGVHTCSPFLLRGTTIRGQSRDGAIIHGSIGISEDPFGAAVVENLTIESTDFSALNVFFGGELIVNDVVIQNSSGSGIWIDGGGSATVNRYRYVTSSGTAIVVANGGVDARGVTADQVFKGALIFNGTLAISDSNLSSDEAAVDAGGINTRGGTRTVTIANTTLRSTRVAITEAAAQVTVVDTTIERGPGTPGRLSNGIELFGGTLTLTRGVLRGWDLTGVTAEPTFDVPFESSIVTAILDQVQIDAGDTGIFYFSNSRGRLSLRNSRVTGQQHGLVVSDSFESVDLGTAGSPGNNQLENGSGGPALEDERGDVGTPLDAHGTTLNGATFEGEVQGPISIPGGYTVSAANTIRF